MSCPCLFKGSESRWAVTKEFAKALCTCTNEFLKAPKIGSFPADFFIHFPAAFRKPLIRVLAAKI
jgi:hypothetical protein